PAGTADRPPAAPSTVLRLPAEGEDTARMLRLGGLSQADLAARLAPLGVRVTL
ncbi:MAG TPA: translation factor Sua5, partial [Deinococcus radiodurans]|nr:translation factor Sua5 [Deinococcus radiodurans]